MTFDRGDFIAARGLLATTLFALMLFIGTPAARAEPFGQCASRHDTDAKIAACLEASRATRYPWILHWVHRELARAYRRQGDREKARTSYLRALAADERACLRREMEELNTIARPM